MSLLSITHIKKSYSTVDGQTLPVLKDITASFDTGELVSIVGESGGGKSTLMNIIAGLDSHFSGDVQVNHQSLRAMSEHQRDRYRRENIGFIFQSFNLISHLTVLENVLVSLKMTNLSRKQQHARAEHLLTQVGLHDRAKVYPNQLSGGQKQRVAIARALASDPEIIIADEPTGALDEQNTQDILHLLDQISASGKLVIAVTHSQIVADHGTRVLHLENGQLVHDTQLKPINSLKQKTEKLATHRLGVRATFLMALKHMQRNLGTNLLITFGGAIGIFSVVVMLALGRGVSGYMHHEISGNLNPTTVEVTHKVKNGNSAAVQMTAHDMKTLSNLPHVTHVEKGYFMPSVQIQYHGQQVTTSYSQTYNKTFFSKNLISGHNPTGNNEIILSRDVAKKYNRHHYQQLLNHQVTIYVNAVDTQQKPVVLSHNMKVVGFTKSSNTAVVSWATIDNMAKAQRIKLQPTFLAVTTDRLSHVKPLQSKIKKLHYNLTGVGAYIDTIDRYVSLASYVLAGIAAWAPAHKAAKLDPVEALSYEQSPYSPF